MTNWRAVRRLVPEVLSALVRRHGQFDACEDAVQEALLAAAAQWTVLGWADRPRGLAGDGRPRAASPTPAVRRTRRRHPRMTMARPSAYPGAELQPLDGPDDT